MRTGPIRSGFLLGAMLVAFGIVYRVGGVDQTSWAGWVFYAMVVGMAFPPVYAAAATVPSSYPRRLGAGAMSTVLGTTIYGAYVFVYNAFIDDALIVSVRDDARTRLEDLGLEAAAIDQRMELVRMLTQPLPFAVMVVLQLTIAGIVACLAMAAFARKRSGGDSARSTTMPRRSSSA